MRSMAPLPIGAKPTAIADLYFENTNGVTDICL